METLITLGVVGAMVVGAVMFAQWYLKNSAAKREEREAADAKREDREKFMATGAGTDEAPPIWDGDDLAHKILNDGFASNAQHVDAEFRRVYWLHAGKGMAAAFRAAMYARCWKSGSQGQVYDRLKSHGKIAEHTRDSWKWLAEREFSSGYGPGPATCKKAPPP